jgi:putative copper export protein
MRLQCSLSGRNNHAPLMLLTITFCFVFFTLFSGLLLKLNINTEDDLDHNGTAFGYFLVIINSLVVLVAFGAFAYEVRTEKNKQNKDDTAVFEPNQSTVSNIVAENQQTV